MSTPIDLLVAALPTVREWVTRLTPHVPDAVAQPAAYATYDTHAGVLGPTVSAWAVETGHAQAVHVLEQMPELDTGPGAREAIRGATESFILSTTRLLLTGDAVVPGLSAEAIHVDHDFVRRGVALETMVRAIQMGYAFSVRRFLSECERLVQDPCERSQQMRDLVTVTQQYYDDFLRDIAEDYRGECARWDNHATATSRAVVQAVLGGEPVDLAAASRALRYELDQTHLGIVLHADTPACSDAKLRAHAGAVLDALGCGRRLIVPIGAYSAWAWGNPTDTAGPDTLALGTPALSALMDTGVRVGYGIALPGLAGFIMSHRQARAVDDYARTHPRERERLIGYEQHQLPVLLSNDPGLAAEVVGRELGALAGPGASCQDLRATALAYLDAERSVGTVAGQLHIARNTVSYRIRRAETLRGRPLSEHRLELHLALLIAQRLLRTTAGAH